MQEIPVEEVRAALLQTYEAAVVIAAQKRGGNPRHFGEAASMLPPEEFDALRDAYRKQVEDLR